MDIAAKKLQLIESLLRVSNEKVLSKIIRLVDNELAAEKDDLLSIAQERTLLEALSQSEEDIAAGRVYSQDEVEKRFSANGKKA